MNEDLAIEALDTVAGLIKRAVEITGKAPYWSFVNDDGKFARLTIQGETTTLRWPDAEMEFESCTLENEQVSFPTRLLFLSDDGLAKWKTAEQRKYRREEAKRGREIQRGREIAERVQYEELKARYG